MAIKRIVIILIIVCVLLSFVEISCLAKESAGEYWNYMHHTDKIVYIAGVIGGVRMWMKQILDHSPHQFTSKEDEVKFSTFALDNFNFLNLFVTDDKKETEKLLETFINVISDLYKDPANTYIPIANMCLIASRKLRGEPIESLLRELRKDAL